MRCGVAPSQYPIEYHACCRRPARGGSYSLAGIQLPQIFDFQPPHTTWIWTKHFIRGVPAPFSKNRRPLSNNVINTNNLAKFWYNVLEDKLLCKHRQTAIKSTRFNIAFFIFVFFFWLTWFKFFAISETLIYIHHILCNTWTPNNKWFMIIGWFE